MLASCVAGLTEPYSKHWALPHNLAAQNVRQRPVLLMADVRPADHFFARTYMPMSCVKCKYRLGFVGKIGYESVDSDTST